MISLFKRAHLYITFQVDVFRAKFLRDHFVYGRIFCVKFCAAKLRIHFAHAKTLEHLEGKQRVCGTNPQNYEVDFGRQATGLSDKPQNFVLPCLLGRKFSFDLFCRFARFETKKRHPKIFLGHLFLCLYFFTSHKINHWHWIRIFIFFKTNNEALNFITLFCFDFFDCKLTKNWIGAFFRL